MGRIAKIKERLRARFYYSQPIYLPGYVYSPWKRWLITGIAAVIILLIAAAMLKNHTTISGTTNNQNSQAAAEYMPPNKSSTPQESNRRTYYPVRRVIDGDTIDVEINGTVERIRFIGVDTPETVDPKKPVQCYGPESSQFVKSLLTGQNVGLESDNSQGNRDIYNRLLRYVFLTDGTNVDEKLIAEGYGREYTYGAPYKYQQQFRQAERKAQSEKLGFWAGNTCNGDTLQPAVQ